MVKNDRHKAAYIFNKIKALIFLLPAYLLIFFSGICEPLSYAAYVLVCVYILLLSPEETILYFIFNEFFSGYQAFFMTGIVACLVNLTIRYIIGIVKKNRKLYLEPLILTLVILVFFSFIHYKIDDNGILQGAIIIAVLIGCYLTFSFRDKIDAYKSTLAGLCGLVVSLVLSAATLIFKNYTFPIAANWGGKLVRFQGLTFNPNYLSILCICILTFCIYNLINRNGKRWINAAGIVLCTISGLLTMSKAFLVILCLVTIYVLIVLVRKFKKKSLFAILPMLAVIVLLLFCFKDFFKTLLERFIAGSEKDTLLSKITTGRTRIWSEYVAAITSSISEMLFGVGLFTMDLPINSPHNTYLFYLYRLGFIGIILLILLAMSYYKCSDKKIKINFYNLLPLTMFLILGLEEMVINERFFIFFVIGLIMLSRSEDKSKGDADSLASTQQSKNIKE